MVNIAFTLTPMSAPGSAALLTLFRLSGTHCCCSTWGGLVFILVLRQECVPLQRCTLRLSVLWHNSIGSLYREIRINEWMIEAQLKIWRMKSRKPCLTCLNVFPQFRKSWILIKNLAPTVNAGFRPHTQI